MSWKKWLGYNLYKKLWILIGKRPWTFIYRDFHRNAEYVIQLIWFSIGVAVGINYGWGGAYIIWGIYTIGFIFGHIHWGKKYIPNQQGQ